MDLTQAVGMIAFGACALACAQLWRYQRHSTWGILAAIHALICAEVFLGIRYEIHDQVNAALQTVGAYGTRAFLQVLLLAAAVALLAAMAWRLRRTGAAVLGTALICVVFIVETVSLHQIDGLLYAQPGPLKVIGYLWVALAVFVVLAARRARR